MGWALGGFFSYVKSFFPIYEDDSDEFFRQSIESKPAPQTLPKPSEAPIQKTGIITQIINKYVVINDDYGFELPEIDYKIKVSK